MSINIYIKIVIEIIGILIINVQQVSNTTGTYNIHLNDFGLTNPNNVNGRNAIQSITQSNNLSYQFIIYKTAPNNGIATIRADVILLSR